MKNIPSLKTLESGSAVISPYPCSDAEGREIAGISRECSAEVSYGVKVNPHDYQFICRDIYGVRFFLNAQVNRGEGYFLTGKWVDAKGVHRVCGIYNEKTRTVSLTLDYRDSREIMSQYTYSGNNRFAGVECNHYSNSFYEMSLYIEKGAFPGLPDTGESRKSEIAVG